MTIKISAAQHFYASIRQDQSPVGRRGLQTLFYTQSLLSKSETREIEDHAQFDSSGEVKSKWQFYCLSSRKAVISYLSLIPEPDEFGRVGRYFAHSLVLDHANWQQLGFSPFALLSDTIFCNSLEEVLKQGNLLSGECPARQIEAELDWIGWAESNSQSWSGENLGNLALAASRANLILEKDSFISLVGENQQIINALGVAFLHTPDRKRQRCSFDTASSNCVWPAPVRFWGHGFSQRDEAQTGIIVDTTLRTIEIPAKYALKKSFSVKPESSDSHHSLQEPAPGERNTTGPQDSPALMQTTDDPGGSSMEDPNREAQASPGNPELIDQRIRELMPPFISHELSEFMLRRAGDTPLKRQRWLNRHPDEGAVGEELFLVLARDWKDWPPSLEDQQALFRIQDRYNGIALLLAVWRKNSAMRQNCLEQMSSEQYLKCLILLNHQRELPSWLFFSLRHLEDWFRYSRRPFLLEDLIRGLTETSAPGDEDFQRLAELINRLDQKHQRSLLHWLRSSSTGFSKLISAFDPIPEKKEGLLSRILNR
jgi:hypothetical protein